MLIILLSPLNFTKTNSLGAHAFFLECIKKKVKKILHVSSDEVYGEKVTGTCFENQLVNPTTHILHRKLQLRY